MRTHSNNFINNLDGIRELSGYISYSSDMANYILTTELDDNLTTELSELIEVSSTDYRVEEQAIKRININTESIMLKSVCTTINITSTEPIPKDIYINVKIGVKSQNGWEYIDYGKFLIIDEPEYEASTKTFNVVAYSDIIRSNIKYEEDIEFPITYNNLLKAIADKFCWECNLNISNTIIQEDIYKNMELTYRDILDDLNKIAYGCFIVNKNKLILKKPVETNNTIVEDEIRDTAVEFGEQLSNINYLSITHNTNVEIDNREITAEEKVEFNINDCYLLNVYSQEFSDEIDTLFTNLQSLSYYYYDINTTGLLIYEPLDIITINVQNNNYKTIIFNNEITLDNGLEENIRADKDDIVDKYTHITKQESKLNNACINIDKANAEIVLKADSNGKMVQARLDADADDGSLFEVKADNIKLEGYTTINNGFSVDLSGNATMRNASITGGSISLSSDTTNPRFVVVNSEDSSKYTQVFPGVIRMFNGNIATLILQNITPTPSLVLYNKNNTNEVAQINSGYIRLDDGSSYTTISAEGIVTPTLTQTSKEEYKKNFEKLDNALNIIKDIDIYKYNMQNEEDKDKKHIGLVIGKKFNYSKEVTSKNNDGVDIYSFVSVCCKAIQEQQEKIEELEKEINLLKGGK